MPQFCSAYGTDVTQWQGYELLVGARELRMTTYTAQHAATRCAGRVRRTRYERAEGLGLQRAQRDLRDLVASDVLTPVGRTRARFYTAGPAFPEPALEAARTPLPLIDPYTC